MTTVKEALDVAARFHQAGQLAEAEMIYRQLLDAVPQHPFVLHQLGTIALQKDDAAGAVDFITRAIAIEPKQASSHLNLAEAYRRQGRLELATMHLEQAIALVPDHTGAYAMMAQVRQQQGDLHGAADFLSQAVSFRPADSLLLGNLGQLKLEQGRAQEAEACFRQVVAATPTDAKAHFNLGSALQEQKRYDEAIDSYRHALAIDSRFGDAWNNLGNIYELLRNREESLACYRQAVAATPDHVLALNNLGSSLSQTSQYEEAIKYFERALTVDPKFAVAHYNLGAALMGLKRFEEALGKYEYALSLDPKMGSAYGGIGNCLRRLGRMPEAVDAFRKNVQLDPEDHACHSNLLYCLNYLPDIGQDGLFSEHRAWAKRHADPFTAAVGPHDNDPSPERRLRIGYVGAYFWLHAVNFFSEPILACHDRTQFDVFCYSDVEWPDTVTARIKSYALTYRDTLKLDDEAVSEAIRADKIDILVDLAGHIAGGRPLVFARKPAPVQVTYIGYQHTTGMRAIDYRLTDEWSDPPGATDRYYSETLVRLPESFFCYRPTPEARLAQAPPDLANGFVTFGSFNDFAKITPDVLATWAEILRVVPGSRLGLLVPASDSLWKYVIESFEKHGIEPARVEAISRSPHIEYLEKINRVDVALDPFPFNGHTTTCDTLWMGVPVVTMLGDAYASRFGSSGLHNLGLDELIARTREEYVNIAVRLAGDLPRLGRWRQELRDRMQKSVICDAATFTRRLESAYRAMWRTWCQGKAMSSGTAG